MAASEFALIAGIMLVLLLAVFDFGLWIWERMQLQTALAAGAGYAQSFPTQTDGIIATISGALPPTATNVTIATPVLSCGCGADDATTACSAACPGEKRVYVTLRVTRPFSPLYFTGADFSGLASNTPSRVVRVQ